MMLWSIALAGQDVAAIQNELFTIETGKSTFRQELKSIGDGLIQYSVVEVDSKGRENESQYIWALADIDLNTVRTFTKKDVIAVQLLVSGKQKLVQVVSDGGDKIAYTNELQLLASNSENGKTLEGLLKQLIPEAIAAEEKRLALEGYQEHMQWLIENVGDVELPKKQIVQKLGKSPNTAALELNQIFNAKSKSETQLRQLNLSTLNPNSISYRIAGEEFTILVETRRGIKGIRYYEDGKQKNYTSSLKLYAKSIANGKDIYKVLRSLIPLASEAFENSQPDMSSEEAALQFLNDQVARVTSGEVALLQNISIERNVAQFKSTESKPDASSDYVYRFNLSDINANNIDYDGQKDRLFVVLPTKKKLKFIQFTKNGALQNYTDNIKIYFNTIEDAIIGQKALKELTGIYEKKMEVLPYSISSSSTTVEKLKELLQKVKIDEDSYDLFIELMDAETNTVKITSVFSNLKKSVESVYEFSLNDINPKNCTIEVRGKHVTVQLTTKHLEKIIKTYIDGEIKPYQYKVNIETLGIEEARQILGIIKSFLEKIE